MCLKKDLISRSAAAGSSVFCCLKRRVVNLDAMEWLLIGRCLLRLIVILWGRDLDRARSNPKCFVFVLTIVKLKGRGGLWRETEWLDFLAKSVSCVIN